MEKSKEEKRQVYIDLLRILCCFGVIVIHVSSIYFDNYEIKSINWIISVIFNIFVRFAVPVFFMISGALFLQRKEINIKKIYTKNILKVLIILAIWLPIYGIISYVYVYNHSFPNFSAFKGIIVGLLDYQYQFWFLIPLIRIYICLPLLKKISEDRKVLKYFLVLFFVFQIIFPTFKPLIGANKYRALTLFGPELVSGYYGYFLLGYYLNSVEISRKKENGIYVLGIVSIIVAVLGTILISNKTGEKIEAFLNPSAITAAIVAVAIFILFKQKISKIKFKDKTHSLITIISNCTMGIYIFHLAIIWIFKKNINLFFATPLIAIPLICLLTFILSSIITLIVKKIPFLGKYIV